MAEKADILELADGLRKEADRIIYGKGIDKLLQPYGDVFYTGSYFLNVMVWPDIDITMALDPDPYSVEDFFEIGGKIARIDSVISLKFNNFFRLEVQDLPEGLYWGICLDMANRNTPWKIDLWAKDKEALAEDRATMQRILFSCYSRNSTYIVLNFVETRRKYFLILARTFCM